ncbi:hypothetical protein [Flavisphingomonas formosensis]|uniref:hypothetical protein n=1 Tax=Flavisphingomonas formosensis TaxID=861534 RepID=UPI0012F737E8|nr:hypothetical protein [Sphingomonas formosensis]
MDDSAERFFRARLTHIQHVALYRKNLRLTCPRCGVSKIHNGAHLWWLFQQKRWDDSMRVVPLRFRCGNCFQQGHGRIRPKVEIVEEDETGPQFPAPDEREWRRMISRFRS